MGAQITRTINIIKNDTLGGETLNSMEEATEANEAQETMGDHTQTADSELKRVCSGIGDHERPWETMNKLRIWI